MTDTTTTATATATTTDVLSPLSSHAFFFFPGAAVRGHGGGASQHHSPEPSGVSVLQSIFPTQPDPISLLTGSTPNLHLIYK